MEKGISGGRELSRFVSSVSENLVVVLAGRERSGKNKGAQSSREVSQPTSNAKMVRLAKKRAG